MSSTIPSLQILTAHAQPFIGARDLAFCLKVPLDLLLVWASSGDSGETAWMRRLAWTFAARIGDKYQIRLTRPILYCTSSRLELITPVAAPPEDVEVKQRNIQWRRQTSWWENLVIVMGYIEPYYYFSHVFLVIYKGNCPMDWVANTLVERNRHSTRPCSLLVCLLAGPLWHVALVIITWFGMHRVEPSPTTLHLEPLSTTWYDDVVTLWATLVVT